MQDNPFARLRRESVAVYASTYAGPLTAPSWTVTGALAVGGNTTLTGALAVTGASAFASTLGVTGATTLAALAATTGAFSGVITSTVATGTAPFTVASTTVVSNLNASFLLGATWAAPGTIGSGTPSTGAFTTITASSTIQATGVLSANTIGVLTGTTATVYNTTSTTVNAFGAATTLTLGAASGTCTIANATVILAGNLQSTVATQFIIQHVPASGAGSIRFSPLPFTTSDAAAVDFFRLSNSTVFSAFTLFYGDGTSKKSFEHRIGASANSTWYDASAVAALTITNSTGAITTGMTTVSLWNTTATTVNAFGAATTLTIGDATASTITLRGGTLVGNTTTQNVFNTTATTVNAFGAATTINIMAAGTMRVGSTSGASQTNIDITTAAGNSRSVRFLSGTGRRWEFGANNTAESGADAGSNFSVSAYNDSGNFIDTVFTIARVAGGNWTVARPISHTSGTFITNQTTYNLINTVATTVNFAGGASTALNIGNATGPITFAGRIVTTLSSTTRAYFNLPHGAAPSAPVNGDMWTTTAGLYVRINGATVGPLS